ncbi:hypothetical protein IAT38_000091 [Cryptococcus sp. DSM 104549]
MAPERPPWVVKDLVKILGLDEESIKQLVVPDLESNNHESRLRIHLQDFLGSSPASKAFINRYIALRFPSLTNTGSGTPQISVTPDPDLLKPSAKKKPGAAGSTGGSRSPAPPSSAGGSSRGGTLDTDALSAAFGPGGKVYQKNRDADDASAQWSFGGRSPSMSGTSRSGAGGGGSGASTPSLRQGGAVHMNVVPARLESGGGGKGKGKAQAEKIWDVPKSKEVKRIEGLVSSLRQVQNRGGKALDGEGPGCFCHSRIHPPSPYTPLCQSCGLIVCALHPAFLPCPSCSQPLYTPAQLSRLILRVETDLEDQLDNEKVAAEAAERAHQAELMAAAGGGAFPTLPGAGPGSSSSAGGPGGQARKVISIGANPKGKGRATVTTTTYRTAPPPSARRPPTPPPTDIMPRPPAAPVDNAKVQKELQKLLKWREEYGRPWGDMKADKRGDGWRYQEMEIVVIRDDEGVGRRKAAKMKRGAGGRVVPGAQT